MPHIKALTGFKKLNESQLVATASSVIKGMTNNPAFATPPVDLAAVQTVIDELNAAIAAQVDGGPSSTVTKNQKRDALTGLLRKLAHHVQAHCNDDLRVLLSSGFQAAATRGSRSPLDKPSILAVHNGHTNQLVVRLAKVSRAKSYELRTAPLTGGSNVGPWQPGGVFTNSRSMTIPGLTSGLSYAVQARAVGGSTGFSDWSDSVTHMCM